MSVLVNEQEQIDAIKNWWKNYGKISLLVFLIGISASYGWRMWQRSQSAFNEQIIKRNADAFLFLYLKLL